LYSIPESDDDLLNYRKIAQLCQRAETIGVMHSGSLPMGVNHLHPSMKICQQHHASPLRLISNL
jgi:hypothetical protein